MSGMSIMQENETAERWTEGLKKAADRAKQIGTLTEDKSWLHLAIQLDALRQKGEALITQKSLSRKRVLEMCDVRALEISGKTHGTKSQDGT